MRNPPDKTRRDPLPPPEYLIKLEKQLGGAMVNEGMASFHIENSGHVQKNGENRGSSGRNIYNLRINYTKDYLRSILLGQRNSNVKELNLNKLESIYNQFKNIPRQDLKNYNLNLLYELKSVFRGIENEGNAQATPQLSSTGVGKKRIREESEAQKESKELKESQAQKSKPDDWLRKVGTWAEDTFALPNQNTQTQQAQTRDPNNWLAQLGTWAENTFKSPDQNPSPPKRRRVDPPSSNIQSSSTIQPQRAFQPNISLISDFIDKDSPSNKYDLQLYFKACDYLRNNRVNEEDLKAKLQSQIGINEKGQLRDGILERFDNVLGFKQGEYEKYKKLKEGEVAKAELQRRLEQELQTQSKEAKNQAKKIKTQKEELAKIFEKEQMYKQKQKTKERALNNPDWKNRVYLQKLYNNFNDSNIDVNRCDDQDYIKNRIIKWNNELEEFGITTLPANKIVDKNLEKYQSDLRENIKNLLAKETEIEDGSKLRNLYSLVAFHELELSKISYAKDWGKYVKREIRGESNTSEGGKIMEILERVPHKKYLTGEKDAETPYYSIKLPPLEKFESSESRPASHPRDLGQLEKFFTRMYTRADIATGGIFSTSLSEGMFSSDKVVISARQKGDRRDEDERWRRKVKEDIEGRVEDLRSWSKKIASRLGERAKPATLSGRSWFDWSVHNGGGGGR